MTDPNDVQTRAETGPMQFGDDWPGVFIRGDNAGGYGVVLEQVANSPDVPVMFKMQLRGLAQLLRMSDARGDLTGLQQMRPFLDAKMEEGDD